MEIKLSKDARLWILDRCSENRFGKVIIPSLCIRKFRSLVVTDLSNAAIRGWILENICNDIHLVDTDHLTFKKILHRESK